MVIWLFVTPLIVTPGLEMLVGDRGDNVSDPPRGESVVEVGASESGVAVPAVQVENTAPLLIEPLRSPTQQITPSTSWSLLLKRSPDGLMILPGQQ